MEVAGKEVPGSRGNDRQGHAGPCERFGYRADGTVTTGAEHGIRTESWSPLAKRSELLTEPILRELAEIHGKSPSQIALRWHVELGSTPIPKSAAPDRQRDNADVFDVELTDDEVAAISALERGRLWGGDPDTHEEM